MEVPLMGMKRVTPGGKLSDRRATVRGGTRHSTTASVSAASVGMPTAISWRHARGRPVLTTGGRTRRASSRPSRTQINSLFKSRAVCHLSSGFLARHLRTTRSRLAGASGCSSLTAGASCSRIAAIRPAWESAANGRVAGQHFVKQRAEREDVGARIHLLAAQLLGRHVGQRADHQPRAVRPATLGDRGGRDAAPARARAAAPGRSPAASRPCSSP